MKIYTKTGDKGTTSLIYGERVSKTDLRVEAYGTCDEANSLLGLALTHLQKLTFSERDEAIKILRKIQTTLFHVGAELATPAGKEVKWKLSEGDIKELEDVIDSWDQQLPPLTNFILPGGGEAGAVLHLARTVVRRAERRAVAIGQDVNKLVCSYLNRLSDFLFVAARFINLKQGKEELTLHQ
ncbi:cob(I)yrinic acid a,c-diamide adenosyltransferase [Cytobacillus sp. S13-E01]|uniref:cob(I)yrinic acid a,c-diamide adenosyltransferase n=1 Tax=Cytobacillus sp. S13-E01 TaxID=3031326 RepID=UPI0023D7E644|nr:cob(I)yrinic acid a,c-diamide adenosyltransferase [Cytobacillus sp. S13-E01]MDF0725945.1 cob(I)yrinic acid a,c-diamide adenosyltransferase [Cytobacillus sp. S13-E01]